MTSPGGQLSGATGRLERWRVPWPAGPGLLFAATTATLVLALRGAVPIEPGPRPMMIVMLLPVILSAYLGGLRPGLLASAVVASGTAFYFLPPAHAFGFERPIDLVQWLVLCGNGGLVSVLLEALHRARRRAGDEAAARQQALDELRTVLTNASCMLWTGTLEGLPGWREADPEVAGLLRWQVTVHEDEAAARLLPLEVLPGQTYTAAWLASRQTGDLGRPGLGLRQRLAAGETGYEHTVRCRDRDGRDRWLREQVTIRPTGPDSWWLVGICTDITSQVEDQESLRAVLTHSRCLHWRAEVTDPLHGRRAPDDRESPLVWRPEAIDQDAAQQVLPLALAPGQDYLEAWLDARHPEDRPATDRVGQTAILTGQQSYALDFRCTDRDGRVRWLHEDTAIVPVGPGRWQLFGVCVDLTDRREAAEELGAVLTHAHCILWRSTVTDPLGGERDAGDLATPLDWDTEIVEVGAAQQVLRLDLRDGETYRSAFHRHREPSDKLATDAVAREAILSGQRGYQTEFRAYDQDGRTRWLHEDVAIVPGPAHQWRVYGVTIDVTARKEAEGEFRTVLTHARCLVWRADVTLVPAAVDGEPPTLDWRPHLVDQAAAQAVVPLDVAPGETYLDAFFDRRHPADRAHSQQVGHAAILGGETFYECDYRCTDRHGRVVWLHQDTVIVSRGPGRWQTFTVCTDITARVEAEQAVRAANAQLEQRVAARTAELTAANQELEAFSYAVSHDLRAPLRAIDGFADALVADCAGELSDEARGYLTQITSACGRMGALIDGLLSLSRATRGALRREPVDLTAMATRIVGELSAGEPSRQVTWRIAAGLTTVADGHMMEIVLQNLLGNAMKYSAKTLHPCIVVDAIELAGERVFRVGDNGAGFDERHAERLFEPFQRLHRQDEYAGLGIGLATAARIIRRHGGRIWCESTVGQGAVFSFTLPFEGLEEQIDEADHNPVG